MQTPKQTHLGSIESEQLLLPRSSNKVLSTDFPSTTLSAGASQNAVKCNLPNEPQLTQTSQTRLQNCRDLVTRLAVYRTAMAGIFISFQLDSELFLPAQAISTIPSHYDKTLRNIFPVAKLAPKNIGHPCRHTQGVSDALLATDKLKIRAAKNS